MSTQPADLAAIATQLAALQERVSHMATAAQVAALTTKVTHLEQLMPRVDVATARSDEAKGWREAKDDSEKDLRATLSLALSGIAIIVSIFTLFGVFQA